MINNINTLQTNLTESSKLTTYTDEYLKESLANLGQRFSVKGDGVSLSEFVISDLFKDSNINNIDNAYACINIKYAGGELNSYNISLSCNNEVVQLESYNDANIYVTEENIITPGSPKNRVSYYNAYSYIQKLDNEYRTAFTGCDTAGNIVETTINNFDIQNNDYSKKLLNGLRFFVSTSDANSKIKAISCSLQKSENSSYYSFTVYDTTFDNLDILDTIIYDNEKLDLDVNNIVTKFVEEKILKIGDGRYTSYIINNEKIIYKEIKK